MARTPSVQVENNLTKGLISQATGMNFPENACTETDNCIFHPWGLVERRLGLDFEAGGTGVDLLSKTQAVTGYFWRDVAGDGNINFYVVQSGRFLNFFRVDPTATTISTGYAGLSVDLQPFQTTGAIDFTTIECQFAAGNGYLFVVNPILNPIAIFYNPMNGTLNPTATTIMIRDFDGTPEAGVSVTARPSVTNDSHTYNLLNQGWTTGSAGDDVSTNRVGTFLSQLSAYPSNADVWWLFNDSTDVFHPGVTNANVSPGNTQAPRGHFILEAFNQNRSAAYGSPINIPTFTSNFLRPSTVAFFAGRVFYTGVQWSGFNQNIYFTQIINTVGAGVPEYSISGVTYNKFGACYQQNDPTSKDAFDLLPDDGGIIRIPDCGSIYKLFAIQNSLVVFASNGIWTITGNSGIGFTANDYSVHKLSSIRCTSATSFIDVQGNPFWWTHDSIYTLKVDTTANVSSGGLSVENLSNTTIADFFSSIPSLSKTFARGCYNPLDFKIRWLFNSTTPFSISQEFQYDSVLCLDTLSGAFYNWSIPIDKVQIRSIFTTVTNNSNVDSYRVKYLVSQPNGGSTSETFHFADEINEDYVDWFSNDNVGESFDSSFTCGFRLHGTKGLTKFQNNYLTVYFQNDDPSLEPQDVASSCYIRGIWDYAQNTSTNRWTGEQLCRVVNNSFSTAVRKIKIRGNGRVLQLKFRSDGALPMAIAGWAVQESANTIP